MLKNFDFIGHRKIFLIISAVIILCGIVGALVMGLNLDIDFVGGTTLQYQMPNTLTNDDLTAIGNAVKEATGITPSSLQRAGDSNSEIIIKTKELTSDQRNAVFEKMQGLYGITTNDILTVDNVSATVGSELRGTAVKAVIIAVILMLLYITVRFQFVTGCAAVLCLVHDMLIMLSGYVLLRIPFNSTVIACLLTILGYSINATIIIFDRVRENKKLMQRSDFKQVLNTSIAQTLNRSIYTSLTTLLVVVMLLIMGVESIKIFALPITIGLIAGAYSSVCLSSGFWYMLAGGKK